MDSRARLAVPSLLAPLRPVLGESDGDSLGQGLFQKNAIFCPIGCAEGTAQERWVQPQTPGFS